MTRINANKDALLGSMLGRYEILELIDTGAWGNVYKARNTMMGTDVAIKILHRHVLKDESAIRRFRREARLLSCFKSAHVIEILDAEIEPFPYIVMEYFDGMPLNKWLKQNGPMNGRMALDLFRQLCIGLSEAESFNIVHRDLKPANILIKTFGDIVEIRIVDFGFARCLDSDSSCGTKITATGDILGSPAYMSPEQFKGQCNSRSDVYSLGCIMYEALAGRPAFIAKNGLEYLHQHLNTTPARISEINEKRELPAGLEELIYRCMEKSARKRCPSATQCKLDLRDIGKNRSKFKHFLAKRHAQQSRVSAGIAVSAFMIALVTAGYFAGQGVSKPAIANGVPLVCSLPNSN